MGYEVRRGDVVEFLQSDGNLMIIYIGEKRVEIKANNPGTEIIVQKIGSFWASVQCINPKGENQ